MCLVCLHNNKATPGCQEGAGQTAVMNDSVFDRVSENSANTRFTNDQIANQLTNGYWSSINEGRRLFNLDSDNTLTYDVSGLDERGRYYAETALEAWSDVTGITFESSQAASFTSVNEGHDAGNTAASAGAMRVNETFNGRLSFGDRDWVKVYLVRNQDYTLTLKGTDTTDELDDPHLRLRDSLGRMIAENDDSIGLDSQVEFRPTQSGYYFLSAAGYDDSRSGRYEMTVTSAPSGSVDLTFDDNDDGAYSTSVTSGTTIRSSHVNVETDWNVGDDSLDTYTFLTYIHEIGHALGLGHGGNYNGTASYGVDNHYSNDSWQSSVMSYFNQSENTVIDADYAVGVTPMVADIIAIQNLYGNQVTSDVRGGNTVYGANSNAGGYLADLFGQLLREDRTDREIYDGNPVSLTIFDTDGTDTLDFNSVVQDQNISLIEESVSDVLGVKGNLVIARGTLIENAKGGSGDDRIDGNDLRNELSGGAGDDTIYGGRGRDTIIGGTGNDDLHGGDKEDTLSGGAGDDDINGDMGNDVLYGGDGKDRLDGEAGQDMLYGDGGDDMLFGGGKRDYIYGAGRDDRLYGNDGFDRLFGGGGEDVLDGGAQSDRLTGGNDADTFVFKTGYGDDRVRDFENNIDELQFDAGLWAGKLNAQEVVDSFANVVGGEAVFDFGEDTLVLNNVVNLQSLVNDIVIV